MPKSFAIGFTIGAALAPAFTNTFKSAGQKMQGFSKALKNAKVGSALADDLIKHQNALSGLRQRMTETGVTGSNLNKRLFELQTRYNQAAEKARKYGLDVGTAVKQQRLFKQAIDNSERSIARLQRREQNRAIRSELHGQMLGTVGMAMVAAAPIKSAMQFESTMADIRKVVDFDSPAGFTKMSSDILIMSRHIPLAASGIGDIIAAAGQAGIAKSELLEFGKTASKMSIAFDLSGKESGKMMAAWRAGMGLDQQRVVSLGDAVNYLSNNLNAEAGALGEVLQRQGSVAMAAGLNEVQAASLGAALLSSGTGAERAATALKNLTGALTIGAAASARQKDAFAALGLDAQEMARAMQDDAVGAIKEVFKAISDQPVEDQNAIVTQLFGEESKGAIMPLLKNMDNLEKAFSLTADQTRYAGSMQKEFAERSNTAANRLVLLKNTIAAAGINIGSVLLPGVNAVTGALTSATGVVADLAQQFPGLTQFTAGAAVGLTALKLAALGAKYGYTILSDGVSIAAGIFNFFRPSVMAANLALVRQGLVTSALAVKTTAMAIGTKAWTAAQWLLNAAMTANPIGLIIAGVGALIAGAVVLYKKWEPFRNFIDYLWEKIKKIGAFLFKFSAIGIGAKLIGTIVDGIRSKSDEPAKAVGDSMKKVDEYMPHSDAKRGPLSNLTASGRSIVETLAKGAAQAKPSGMDASLQRLAGMTAGGIGGRGAVTVNFSPTISISAGSGDAAAMRNAAQVGIETGGRRLIESIQAFFADEQRLSYA